MTSLACSHFSWYHVILYLLSLVLVTYPLSLPVFYCNWVVFFFLTNFLPFFNSLEVPWPNFIIFIVIVLLTYCYVTNYLKTRQLKTAMNIYYFTVLVGQEFGSGLTGWFWLESLKRTWSKFSWVGLQSFDGLPRWR